MLLATLMSVKADRTVIFEGDDYAHPAVIPLTLYQDGVSLSLYGTVRTNGLFMYAGHESSLSVQDGKIVQIVFERLGSTTFTFSSGNFSVYEGTGYWTGSVSSVIFVPSNNIVVSRIIVTVEGGGPSAPRISPEAGTYYHPIDVSITCSTPDAKIYYTTDGSTPTTASTEYTTPFNLSAHTTVTAISVLDDKVSDVVIARYVFPNVPPVQDIWESLLLEDGTTVRFSNPVQVVYQRNKYLYVRDGSAYTLFYGDTKQTYKTGDTIPAGFIGTLTTYNCERELMNLADFSPASGNTPIEPEFITADQIGHNTFAHLVKVSHVTFSHEGNSYYITDGNGNRASVYFNMGVSAPSDLSIPYDVIGVVGSYQTSSGDCIYQLLPIDIGAGHPVVPDATFTVIHQSNPYLFVKVHEKSPVDPGVVIPLEETVEKDYYMLVYGYLTNRFVNGDVIVNPRFTVSEYAGNQQYVPVDETFVLAYHGDPVEPEEIPIEEVSCDMIYWYLIFRGVDYVGADSGLQPCISDDMGDMPIYNRFNVPVTTYNPVSSYDLNEDSEVNVADVNAVIDNILYGSTVEDPLYGKYDVSGILTIYKNMIELYPIKIVYHANRYLTRGDVNGDGEVNISDVNLLIDYILSH